MSKAAAVKPKICCATKSEGADVIIESHNRLKDPLRVKSSRVLITADNGTPVAMIVEYVAGATDRGSGAFGLVIRNFNEQLQVHGFTQTVLVI